MRLIAAISSCILAVLRPVTPKMPSPPASDTEATIDVEVADAIPPRTIGCLMFNLSQTGVLIKINNLLKSLSSCPKIS